MYLHRFAFAIILAVVFGLGGCGSAESASRRPEAYETNSSRQEIEIGAIWEHPDEFKDRKVLVRGSYLGWKGQVEHPQVTRSDWALQDETGAIYVTGMPAKGLDPAHDIGRQLEVSGTVVLNDRAVPYIRAERVVLMDLE